MFLKVNSMNYLTQLTSIMLLSGFVIGCANDSSTSDATVESKDRSASSGFASSPGGAPTSSSNITPHSSTASGNSVPGNATSENRSTANQASSSPSIEQDDMPARVSGAGEGDAATRRNIPTVVPAMVIPAETALGTNKRLFYSAMSPDGSKYLAVCSAGKKEHEIRCLDTTTGNLLWAIKADGRMGHAGCSDKYALVLSNDPKIDSYAISLADGKVISRGSLDTLDNYQRGPIVIDDENMQAVFINNGLVTVDLNSGEHAHIPLPENFWEGNRKPAGAAYNPKSRTFVMASPPENWATWKIGDAAPVKCKPLDLDGKPLRWSPLYGLAGDNLILGKAGSVRLVVDFVTQKIVQTSEDAFREAQQGVPVEERSNRVGLDYETRGVSQNGKFAILATQMGLDPKQKAVVYDFQDIERPTPLLELEYNTKLKPGGRNWEAAEFLSSRGSQISNDGKTVVFKTENGNIVVFNR